MVQSRAVEEPLLELRPGCGGRRGLDQDEGDQATAGPGVTVTFYYPAGVKLPGSTFNGLQTVARVLRVWRRIDAVGKQQLATDDQKKAQRVFGAKLENSGAEICRSQNGPTKRILADGAVGRLQILIDGVTSWSF